MTNEERRFKVKKVEKYKKIVDKEEKKEAILTLVTGIMAIGVVSLHILYSRFITIGVDSTTISLFSFMANFCTVMGIDSLISTIKSIIKKTIYEKDLEDLEDELAMESEKEKKIGVR